MSDRLVRILTGDGTLRAAAAVTTTLVGEICRRQGTDPTATVALGRLATGAVLLGSILKDRQRLALQIEANGPLQKLQAEVDAEGGVRASVRVPRCDLPPRDGRFDVAGAVGKAGFLHVVKDLGLREPYRGTVQLASSEIAEDLAWYLTTSEQIPSSVALGVLPGDAGGVAVAGGFLVQAMPGALPEELAAIEDRILALPPLGTMLRDGLSPEEILAKIFADIPFSLPTSTPLHFSCSCSRRQARAILMTLSAEERAAHGDAELTVTCEYCREIYSFTGAELGNCT